MKTANNVLYTLGHKMYIKFEINGTPKTIWKKVLCHKKEKKLKQAVKSQLK